MRTLTHSGISHSEFLTHRVRHISEETRLYMELDDQCESDGWGSRLCNRSALWGHFDASLGREASKRPMFCPIKKYRSQWPVRSSASSLSFSLLLHPVYCSTAAHTQRGLPRFIFHFSLSTSSTPDKMKTTTASGRVTVEQEPVVIPDLTIKDLLSAIPYVPALLRPPPSRNSRIFVSTGSIASSGRPSGHPSTCTPILHLQRVIFY